MVDDKRLLLIHSFPNWLPQTQTWMYTQARHIPDYVIQHIVCEQTQNLDQFNRPNIHCLINESWVYAKWEKILRNINIRSGHSYLRTISEKIDANIIHSHFGNIGWQNQKAIDALKVKHIVTFYGYDISLLPKKHARWVDRYAELFDRADRFLCEGPFMAGQLVKLGCSENKVKVQHLGVDVNRILFTPRKWEPTEPLKILIAAGFTEKKGIPYALEAIAEFRKKHSVLITIIGDSNKKNQDNSEKNKILSVIQNRGLSDCTRLLGFQPYSRLFEEAYQNHVFISPSITASTGDTEGGAPVSLIDMMATGMPVVSTRHCDIPEVVQYGRDDWLTDEKDIAGLTLRLEWLADHPENWEKMVSVGRAHIEKEYDAEKQGVRLGEIYKELLLP